MTTLFSRLRDAARAFEQAIRARTCPRCGRVMEPAAVAGGWRCRRCVP